MCGLVSGDPFAETALYADRVDRVISKSNGYIRCREPSADGYRNRGEGIVADTGLSEAGVRRLRDATFASIGKLDGTVVGAPPAEVEAQLEALGYR